MPILLPAYVTSSTSGTPTSIPATPSGPAILPIDAPSNEISLTGVVVAVLGILMTAVMTAVGFWLARNRLPNIETAHRFVESVRDAFGLDPQEQATTSGGTAPTHEQTAGAADGSEPASSLQQRRTPNSIVPEVDTMELDDLASTLEQQGSAFGEQPGGSVQEPGPASSLQQHSNLNPVETEVYGIELDALATSQQHSRTFEQSGYGEAAHGLSCSQAPTHENEAANNASSLERSALSLGAPIIASDIEHLPGEHGAANDGHGIEHLPNENGATNNAPGTAAPADENGAAHNAPGIELPADQNGAANDANNLEPPRALAAIIYDALSPLLEGLGVVVTGLAQMAVDATR